MEFEFKAKKENRLVAWFKKLSGRKKFVLISVSVILVIILILVGFVMAKLSKINTDKDLKEEDILVNEFLDEEVGVGYTNFVLFGADSRVNDVENDLNTDAIIIVSLNNETKEVKMCSVFRDTLMDIKGNNIQKCNSAYRRGGAKQAINMLNTNLDLNIQKYVTVSWSVVADVVDMVGGIEVDVTEAEVKETNKHIDHTASVVGKKAKHLRKAGVQTLDGVQAATYARIRKNVGNDFGRTERQREVVKLVAEKAMKSDLKTINNIIDTIFPQVSTNLSMAEILKYLKDIARYEFGESSGFPFERDSKMLGKRGSCTFATDLAENVTMLHEFLYGTVDYEPSSKVQSISEEIDYIVRTNASSDDEDKDNEDEDNEDDEEVTTKDKEETTEEADKSPVTTTEEENTTAGTTEDTSSDEKEPASTEQEKPTEPENSGQEDNGQNSNGQEGSDSTGASEELSDDTAGAAE